MIYRKHPIRSLLTSMLRKANIRYPSDVYALSFESIKGSNYGEFLKDKNVLLMYTTVLSLTAYKYAPNLESLLTQQYVCVMCTLWSDNTCVFNRFYSVKNANTQLIWSSVPYSKNILQDMQSQNITRQAVTRYYKTCSHKIYKTCSHKILHVKFNIEIWILLVHTLLVAQDDTLRLIPC
jgi:hypothetical protein